MKAFVLAEEEHLKWKVYALMDPTGAIRYIGKTNDTRRRLYRHINETTKRAPHLPVARWVEKLKKADQLPSLVVLEKFATEDESLEREIYWIAKLRNENQNLLNVTSGGDGWRSCDFTDEIRRMIGLRTRGKKRPPFSADWRQKISASKKGVPGHPHTLKSRERIGIANRGRRRSLEMRVNLARSKSQFTDEQTAKIAADRPFLTFKKISEIWGVSVCCIQKAIRRHERILELTGVA